MFEHFVMVRVMSGNQLLFRSHDRMTTEGHVQALYVDLRNDNCCAFILPGLDRNFECNRLAKVNLFWCHERPLKRVVGIEVAAQFGLHVLSEPGRSIFRRQKKLVADVYLPL